MLLDFRQLIQHTKRPYMTVVVMIDGDVVMLETGVHKFSVNSYSIPYYSNYTQMIYIRRLYAFESSAHAFLDGYPRAIRLSSQMIARRNNPIAGAESRLQRAASASLSTIEIDSSRSARRLNVPVAPLARVNAPTTRRSRIIPSNSSPRTRIVLLP